MIKKALVALLLMTSVALAQSSADNSVIGFYLAPGSTSGSFTCKSNNIGPCFVPYGGTIPVSGSFSPSGNQLVNIDQTTPGTTNGVVVNSSALPTGGSTSALQTTGNTSLSTIVTNTNRSRTLVTLDVKTVTTGGTAVTALTAGHRTAGGFLQNPVGATVSLCINEIGTASGTTSSGDTTCIQPGQTYNIAPASTAVSVISSDSAHPFSGYGLN